MKQPKVIAPGLKEFHWEDLANLRVDLGYYRHLFIHIVNEKVSIQKIASIEELDRLAQVDELLKEAADKLEAAKAVLFNVCYEHGDEEETSRA